MKSIVFFVSLFFFNSLIFSQSNKLVSGPWAGNVQLRTAIIWAEVSADVKKVAVKYFKTNTLNQKQTVLYKGELAKNFNPIKIEITEWIKR